MIDELFQVGNHYTMKTKGRREGKSQISKDKAQNLQKGEGKSDRERDREKKKSHHPKRVERESEKENKKAKTNSNKIQKTKNKKKTYTHTNKKTSQTGNARVIQVSKKPYPGFRRI